ncbi:MAG: SPOR domain-containing protein [Spirochaetaceae bacterium]|nr:SPOR domain-containing protein [Spirochaetaceae bacterium]
MEQQKILWVTLSIAILLLAILGSTLFIFGSSNAADQTARVADVRSDRDRFDPIEWARTGREYPTLNDTAQQNNNDGGFVVGGAVAPGTDTVIAPDAADNRNVVSLPIQRIEQPRVPAAATATTPATAPAAATAPVATAPRTEPAPAARRADSGARPVAPATPRSVREYWIQTNSFSTVVRAEEERRVITSKGFPAVIQTRVVGDRTFYRVRVGAYSTREEAEKFLFWIRNINGFESSLIYEVTARREM